MDTDALISRLADSAEPVRRLPPAWKRAALWLALGLPPLIAIVAVHGLAVDLSALVDDRRMMIEQAAALLTAMTAASAAFASTIPGVGRKWFWLPVLPLSVWLLTVGRGCIEDWLRLGGAGLSLRPDGGCFLPMVLMGVVPTLAMVMMLRRGAALSPRLTLILGTLAIAAFVNVGLRFFHVGDVSIMVLVWHFGLVAFLSVIAGWVGPRLLGWPSAVAR